MKARFIYCIYWISLHNVIYTYIYIYTHFFAFGEHASFKVHVVGAYKHLWGIIHNSVSQGKEAQQRLVIAHQALSCHRKLLLHNPTIAFPRRRELFESLVLSAFTYGMESWHFFDQKTKNMLRNGQWRHSLLQALPSCAP